jgi:ATPase family AAA domain-containing protein 3A/B
MHVCAHAGDLDDAVLDRMDEALEFGLPGLDERIQMLNLYLDK